MVTVVLWAFYVLGFLIWFSPFYLWAFFFSSHREEAFQRLNHRFYRSFFTLLRALVPNVTWRISEEVKALRSSMIFANHLSFLDPILLVSLFERQKTIVKSDYFRFPVFGRILRASGYIPAAGEGPLTVHRIDQIKSMKDYLMSGGNCFIFPEGTRSRDRRLGAFDQGAFKIARLCRARPIRVVRIRNTDRLFAPDRFLFNTAGEYVIDVELAGSIEPDYEEDRFSLSGLMADVRSALEGKTMQDKSGLI